MWKLWLCTRSHRTDTISHSSKRHKTCCISHNWEQQEQLLTASRLICRLPKPYLLLILNRKSQIIQFCYRKTINLHRTRNLHLLIWIRQWQLTRWCKQKARSLIDHLSRQSSQPKSSSKIVRNREFNSNKRDKLQVTGLLQRFLLPARNSNSNHLGWLSNCRRQTLFCQMQLQSSTKPRNTKLLPKQKLSKLKARNNC